MIKFYTLDGCGYCSMVRKVLDQLEVPYEAVDVPWPHHLRQEVFELSGQTYVPVLVDGDTILDDEYEIIDYLKTTYAKNTN